MPALAFIDISERLTRALVTGDFDLYRSVIALPLRIEPRAGKPYDLDTRDHLECDFNLYHQSIRTHGVTDIYREVRAITQPAPDRVEIACITHILARANRIVDPFDTLIVLRPVLPDLPPDWRITRIQSSEGHINWTLGRATITDGGFSPSDPDTLPTGG